MNNSIIQEQLQIVMQFACNITNAVERKDSRTERKSYRQLELYVQEQVKQKRSHPFIIETLADYTDNNTKAIKLYRRALKLARKRRIEGHTILFELARQHFDIKNKKGLAWRYLRASLVEARRRKDKDFIKEAEDFSQQHKQRAT